VKDSGAWNELVSDEMVGFEGDLIAEEDFVARRHFTLEAWHLGSLV